MIQRRWNYKLTIFQTFNFTLYKLSFTYLTSNFPQLHRLLVGFFNVYFCSLFFMEESFEAFQWIDVLTDIISGLIICKMILQMIISDVVFTMTVGIVFLS